MSDAKLRSDIAELRKEFALHDQRAGHAIEDITEQGRETKEAVQAIRDATVRIADGIEHMANNGNRTTVAFKLNPKAMLAAGSLLLALIGSNCMGPEVGHQIFHALTRTVHGAGE